MPDLRSSLAELAGDLPDISESEIDRAWRSGRRRRLVRMATRVTSLATAVAVVALLGAILRTSDEPSRVAMVSAPSIVECLSREGFEGVATAQGVAFEFEDGPEYRRYREASERCVELLGLGPRRLTRQDVERSYVEQLATARCLADHGYPGDVPSLAEFLAQRRPMMESDGPHALTGDFWIAYNVDIDGGQAEWDRLNSVCPQPR